MTYSKSTKKCILPKKPAIQIVFYKQYRIFPINPISNYGRAECKTSPWFSKNAP